MDWEDEVFKMNCRFRIQYAFSIGISLFCLAIFSGCAKDRYLYGPRTQVQSPIPIESPLNHPVSIGPEYPKLDRIEKWTQWRPWSPNETCETLSPEDCESSISLTRQYLEANGMKDVYVDVRRYEPAEQWKRLRDNQRIHPLLKYSFGLLDLAGYTLLPDRPFRTNSYSPWTRTLSINSSDSSRALLEAAQAKEFSHVRWPGIYAACQQAPVFGFVHQANSATDALSFAKAHGQTELMQSLYPASYSRLGSELVSDALFFFPWSTDVPQLANPATRIAGGLTGRAIGQAIADFSTSAKSNSTEPISDRRISETTEVDAQTLKPVDRR